jgi:hypothetical protein
MDHYYQDIGKEEIAMNHYFQDIGEDWFSYPELYSAAVQYFQPKSNFYEIGSWKGRSSVYMGVEIINSNKQHSFTCVDTWAGCDFTKDLKSIKEKTLYDEFLTNIEPLNGLIIPVKSTSLEAAKLVADESLDFCFIDASHDYDNVIADIHAWFPKVKQGGVIAGHDYPDWEGVKKAVDEFFGENIVSKYSCWIHQIAPKKDFYNLLK